MEEKSTPDGCKYRPRGVTCRDWRRCAKCGWSPVGEKRRKEKINPHED